MPVFNLSVHKLSDGIFDVVGKTIAISPRQKRKMTDFSRVWKKSNPAMKTNTVEVWAAGQKSWNPLNKDYKKWKRLHGYSTKKNVKTGGMYEAMKYGQLNEMAPMVWTWGIDSNSFLWYRGSSTEPYPVHANKLRPFMVMTEKLVKTVQDNMKNYILKIFKGKV